MSVVVQYTKNGEPHGLIGVLTNSVPFDDFKHMEPKYKAKCEKEKKEDCRLVKVRYINSRGKHEKLEKVYCRWSGESIQQWVLIPGYTYEVPMGMVKEVNASKIPRRSGLISVDGKDLNSQGSPLDKDEEMDPLHQLVPAEFF